MILVAIIREINQVLPIHTGNHSVLTLLKDDSPAKSSQKDLHTGIYSGFLWSIRESNQGFTGIHSGFQDLDMGIYSGLCGN
jgi:hypothetical protein